jgi:hypothetical protein
VRFKGMKGTSYTGDMSVDNVLISAVTAAPPPPAPAPPPPPPPSGPTVIKAQGGRSTSSSSRPGCGSLPPLVGQTNCAGCAGLAFVQPLGVCSGCALDTGATITSANARRGLGVPLGLQIPAVMCPAASSAEWVQVDLGRTICVRRIKIWARCDCCSDEMRGAWAEVLVNGSWTRCSTTVSTDVGVSRSFSFDCALTGNAVRVKRDGGWLQRPYFSMSGIEVFGAVSTAISTMYGSNCPQSDACQSHCTHACSNLNGRDLNAECGGCTGAHHQCKRGAPGFHCGNDATHDLDGVIIGMIISFLCVVMSIWQIRKRHHHHKYGHRRHHRHMLMTSEQRVDFDKPHDAVPRQHIEATAIDIHEMHHLANQMLVPIVEYIVRRTTNLQEAMTTSSPVVCKLRRGRILVALEEKADISGNLWIQCRGEGSDANKLGWVLVVALWDESDDSSRPCRRGLPDSFDKSIVPPQGGDRVGYAFRDQPHAHFLIHLACSFKTCQHWRRAFTKARVHGNDITAATTMFAPIKIDRKAVGRINIRKGIHVDKFYYEVQLHFSGIAQLGWARQGYTRKSKRACFVGNCKDSWGFDGHRWFVWHDGAAKTVPPFDKTTHVRVLAHNTAGRSITLMYVHKQPSLTSSFTQAEMPPSVVLTVTDEKTNDQGSWVYLSGEQSFGDQSVRGWVRLPNTGTLAKRKLKKLLHDYPQVLKRMLRKEHRFIERVTEDNYADTASNEASIMRWKPGDIVGCCLELDHEGGVAKFGWEINGRRLPVKVETELYDDDQFYPVLSAVGGAANRETMSVHISPNDMVHDVPSGYRTLVCNVQHHSTAQYVQVVDMSSGQSHEQARLLTLDVSMPDVVPGTHVEVNLPSGLKTWYWAPEKSDSAQNSQVVTMNNADFPGWTGEFHDTASVPHVGVDAGQPVTINARQVPQLNHEEDIIWELPVGSQLAVLSEMQNRTGTWMLLESKATTRSGESGLATRIQGGTAGEYHQSAPRSNPPVQFQNPLHSVDDTGLTSSSPVPHIPAAVKPTVTGLTITTEPTTIVGWILCHAARSRHIKHETHGLKRVVDAARQLIACKTFLKEIPLRKRPTSKARIVFDIYPGEELELVDEQPYLLDKAVVEAHRVWLNVRTLSGQVGWIVAVDHTKGNSMRRWFVKAQDSRVELKISRLAQAQSDASSITVTVPSSDNQQDAGPLRNICRATREIKVHARSDIKSEAIGSLANDDIIELLEVVAGNVDGEARDTMGRIKGGWVKLEPNEPSLEVCNLQGLATPGETMVVVDPVQTSIMKQLNVTIPDYTEWTIVAGDAQTTVQSSAKEGASQNTNARVMTVADGIQLPLDSRSGIGYTFSVSFATLETDEHANTQISQDVDGDGPAIAQESPGGVLTVIDDRGQSCQLSLAEDGRGFTATTRKPASVRGRSGQRSGTGQRWYFEVRVEAEGAIVGICSADFGQRKMTRVHQKTSRLHHLGRQPRGVHQQTSKKPEEEDIQDVNTDADGMPNNGWIFTEDAFVLPRVDLKMVNREERYLQTHKRERVTQAERRELWVAGDKFRAMVDQQLYAVAVPEDWDGGPVSFSVRSTYCRLGEDAHSLNVGYGQRHGVWKSSEAYDNMPCIVRSQNLAKYLPDVRLDRRNKHKHKLSLREGDELPAEISSETGNECAGFIGNCLSSWRPGDIVGVCVDTMERSVVYTLNGMCIGQVDYESQGGTPWFPAASIVSGNVTFYFTEESLHHLPPKNDCRFLTSFGHATEDDEDLLEVAVVTVPYKGAVVPKFVDYTTADGQHVKIPVPPGKKAGDVFEHRLEGSTTLGYFQVMQKMRLRKQFDRKSKTVGFLKVGQVIAVYDRRVDKRKNLSVERARCGTQHCHCL